MTIAGLAVGAGALGVAFPTLSILVLGTVAAGAFLSMFLSRVKSRLANVQGGIWLQAALALTMISIVRVERRDPRAEDLGTQAMFEFALQGLAIVLVAIAFKDPRIRFSLSPALLLWIAVGTLAVASAFWAPQTKLALFKGVQLIVICVIAAIAAGQFRDRYQAVRFLTWLAVIVIVGMLVYQVATQGFSSLWWQEGRHLWGFGEGDGVSSRYRLRLASVHPLVLGGFVGAAALLILTHRPQRSDWVAFGLLFAVGALTYARAAFILLCLFTIVCLILRAVNLRHYRLLAFTTLVFVSSLIVWIMVDISTPGTGGPSTLINLDSSDVRTLNGRVPLWEATLARNEADSDHQLTRLVGSGYVSFRLVGLDVIRFGGDAHNAAFQILFELGAFGLMLWLSAVFWCGFQVWRQESGVTAKCISILPIAYILSIQMTDATLADSRSFLLVILLFYAHVGWSATGRDTQSFPEVVPVNRSAGGVSTRTADGTLRTRSGRSMLTAPGNVS